MKKKKIKYVLYLNKRNSLDSKIINSGTTPKPMTRHELVIELNQLYGIAARGGLKYDGRCGLYTIYRTDVDSRGLYNVLHIER